MSLPQIPELQEAPLDELIGFITSCQRYMAESRGDLPQDHLRAVVKATHRVRELTLSSRGRKPSKPKEPLDPPPDLDDLL